MKKKKNSRKSNPLPFDISFFTKKVPLSYSFYLLQIWFHFHIPCLELCIPFDCCKSQLVSSNNYLQMYCFFFTQKSISKIACTQKLFYFSFRSYPLALAVNKFPAFYILSPTLDGLCRGNRGSVNRLSQKQNVLSTSQSHIIHLLALLGRLTDPNDRFSHPFIYFNQ